MRDNIKKSNRSLVPVFKKDPSNDVVFTPKNLAKDIIDHFNPTGSILDPCSGEGVFFNNFPQNDGNDWCEITKGRDFFNHSKKHDWIVSNPPWSLIRPFLKHSMELSDNIVFLCLVNAFFMKARLRDMKEHNFGIKEIYFVDTPPKPWPATGFALGAIYVKRGWNGDIKVSNSGLKF